MSNILINGPSATGKTTIGNELERLGYKVINTDEEFGYYGNLKTLQPVNFPGPNVNEDWYKENAWIWDSEKVNRALSNDEDIVFFCGGALNEAEFYDKFDKIFRLIVDPKTLIKRLEARGSDQHTNNPKFKKRMLDYLAKIKNGERLTNEIVIDTSLNNTHEYVDIIISQILDGLNKSR